MALAIATGFVVDDAIVVIENVSRHLEAGMQPLAAALQGAKEISFTVVSMSVSLVAVFIPLLLMSGVVGRLFREFSVTLSVAIGVSMVVSLTTTPMMCAALLRPRDEQKHNWFYRVTERGFDSILKFYSWSLSRVLHHEVLVLTVTLATIGLTAFLYIYIPRGYFPQQDTTGRLNGSITADQATSFQSMNRLLTRFVTTVQKDKSVAGVIAFCGGRGTTNGGQMFITLKPAAAGGDGMTELVMGRLRKSLANIPGATPCIYRRFKTCTQGGKRSAARFINTHFRGMMLQELLGWAPKMTAKLQKLPGLVDVNSDQQNKGLTASLNIDRQTASRLGITAQAIDAVLYDAFGQRQVSGDVHTVESVSRRHGGRSDVLAESGRAKIYLCQSEQWSSGPAERVLQLWNFDPAAHDQPSGPISVRDNLVQSGAGDRAGDGDFGNSGGAASNGVCPPRFMAFLRDQHKRIRIRSPTN